MTEANFSHPIVASATATMPSPSVPDQSTDSSGRYWLLVTGIGVLALAIRLGCTIWFQGLNSPPKYDAAPDQCEYELLAYHMSIGEGYALSPGVATARRPPGTSFTLLPVYLIFGRSFVAGRIWFCLLSAATCVATAWMVRGGFGRTASLLAALWLACYPGHFYYSMHFLSEVPFGLWLALACGATMRGLQSGHVMTNAVAGVFWTVAVLTRPQLLVVGPIGWLLLLVVGRKRLRVLSAALAVQTLSHMVTLMPWVVRNAVTIGKPTICTIVGGFGFWIGNNDLVLNDPALKGTCAVLSALKDAEHPIKGTEVEQDSQAWRYGLDFVKSNLRHLPGLFLMKLWRFWSPFSDTTNRTVYWALGAGWILTAPFFVLGLLTGIRQNAAASIVFIAPVLAMLVITVIFYGLDRYRDSLAPVLLAFAACGAVELATVAQRKLRAEGMNPV